MNADIASAQRIGRLTPLADVLALIDRVAAVAPRAIGAAEATGLALAADVVANARKPAQARALCDGWAVESERTRDAGPYAPVVLQPHRIDAFMPLPAGTDAVAPLDAVSTRGGVMQIVVPVAPGEGVLVAGGDIEAGATLFESGRRLRATDVAILAAADITHVAVRAPAVCVVKTDRRDPVLDAIAKFTRAAVRAAGGEPVPGDDLDSALRDRRADAVIGIGGTGSGRNDRSVIALKRAGQLGCHGVGLMPGETAAFGNVGSRPVLLMPGRIDGALAAWLVAGQRLLARLCGYAPHADASMAILARKVTSTVGVAGIVPVRSEGAAVTPLGSGYLSLQMLAQADGWILVPAGSEGYPAGSEVEMRPLP